MFSIPSLEDVENDAEGKSDVVVVVALELHNTTGHCRDDYKVASSATLNK